MPFKWGSPVKWGVLLLALLLAAAACLSFAERSGWAQDPAGTSAAGGVAGSNSAAAFRAPFRVELDQPPARPTLTQRIDGQFARIVNYMQTVLFYRLGQREQRYLQFEQNEYYVRDRDSDGPFTMLDPSGQPTETQLSPQEVERRTILGKFVRDAEGRAIRLGRVGNRLVEFVTVKINDSRYVQRGESFLRLTPMRDLLDEQDVMTPQQAEQAARRGELQLAGPKDADPARPFVLTAYVGGIPIVVAWLALGAVIFTFYMGFYNVFAFGHAIQVVRGRYDNPSETGEVTHFQALASALSATVGLGNIAGVTIAMTLGGPGAFFWMMFCGVFGMSSKFVECTLGQKYRQIKPDGTVLGGPMQYLYSGLRELGLGPLGLVLSLIFAVMCILASFGGGNMFQANQSGQQVLTMLQRSDYRQMDALDGQIRAAADAGDFDQLRQLQDQRTQLTASMERFANYFKPAYGLVLAFFVGIVIIGGIKRIGAAAEKVVPAMCLIYMAACVWIIAVHIQDVPPMVGLIFSEAFSPRAFGGGMLGVLVIGVQRAAFSNEAGVGSASIAHSAARTEEPVREGTVALLEPFIDTVVVCSMTALVILVTGAWTNESWIVDQGLQGTPLTSRAFEQEIRWFPYILTVAVVLFAYSTLISWSYYGERCWVRLFGHRSTLVYKGIYVTAAFVGSVANLGAVLDFSDMMILSMAFPNILGLLLLSPGVRRDMLSYWRRYKAGEFKTYK
ncbi:MAG: alanine:cation symporter family protein [Pirellulaceae bacterium]|nr:alanine:cation symporter family protein [Pirellulaceae bacterium]